MVDTENASQAIFKNALLTSPGSRCRQQREPRSNFDNVNLENADFTDVGSLKTKNFMDLHGVLSPFWISRA